MQAQDVYKTVSARLQDLKITRRWSWEAPSTSEDASLQDFLNNALLNVVLQRPDASSVVKTHICVEGCKQALTSDDLCLLDCIYSLDENGDPDTVLTLIDRKDLDIYNSSWYQSKDSAPYHWAYDRLNAPRIFWVYPGCATGDSLLVNVSEKPTTISAPTTTISIPDLYKPALDAWVLYEVLASDTDDANWQKATQYQQTFYQILGVKLQTDMTNPINLRKNEGT